jgi:hypothetical protein
MRNYMQYLYTVHNFCASPNIIRVTKSRRMRLAGHIERKQEQINGYNIVTRLEERDHLKYLYVNGRMLLKWAWKQNRRRWFGLISIRVETSGRFM